jgi:hypothetical protein
VFPLRSAKDSLKEMADCGGVFVNGSTQPFKKVFPLWSAKDSLKEMAD